MGNGGGASRSLSPSTAWSFVVDSVVFSTTPSEGAGPRDQLGSDDNSCI